MVTMSRIRPFRRFGALLVLVASGCWLQPGFNAAHQSFDPHEHKITAANVGTLTQAWAVDNSQGDDEPLAFEGAVYDSGGGEAHSYDLATGALRWTRSLDIDGTGTTNVQQLVANGNHVDAVVAATYEAGTVGFDDKTGGPAGGGFAIHTGFATQLIAGPRGTTAIEGTFGSNTPILFVATYGGDPYYVDFASYPVPSSPGLSIVGDHLLIPWGTTLTSFTASTCTKTPSSNGFCVPQWSVTLPAVPHLVVGIGSDKLAIAYPNGDIEVRAVADGSLLWTDVTGATDATPPAVGNGLLYTGAPNGTVYAFAAGGCGAATCAPTWSVSTGSAAISDQPAATTGVVYAGTVDGRVVGFAANGCGAATCPLLWTADVDTRPAVDHAVEGPIVADGHVVAATHAGRLVVFDLPA
jgi:hypothetical protein